MSRIGRKPIDRPGQGEGLDRRRRPSRSRAPRVKLPFTHRESEISVAYDDTSKQVLVTSGNDCCESRALHGLTRSLVNNMVVGVTTGYFQAARDRGRRLPGPAEEGQHRRAPGRIRQPDHARSARGRRPVVGPRPHAYRRSRAAPDKQAVGQFAAEVRKVRPPSPGKGKGIRYEGEVVRRKAGKAHNGAGAPADAIPPREDQTIPQRRGWAPGRDRSPQNPPSQRRRGTSGEPAQGDHRRCVGSDASATGPQDSSTGRPGAASPGRIFRGSPELHLRPGHQRRQRHHPGLGQSTLDPRSSRQS